MRDHVLILGSAPVSLDLVRHVADTAQVTICADGGASTALVAGITVHLVVGDMDSISSEAECRFESAGVRFVRHPRDKDQTDLELALDEALSLMPERITVLGALGGERLDHTLGNVLLLAQPRLRHTDIRMLDERGSAFVVWDHRSLHGSPGDYVSLLPLTPQVEGIITTGLRFALLDDTLVQGSTRGVSNELTGHTAIVEVKLGCLLVRHELEPAPLDASAAPRRP